MAEEEVRAKLILVQRELAALERRFSDMEGVVGYMVGVFSSSPYQLLTPDIMYKTAQYMRAKYRRFPEAVHAHDLTRCSLKREMEERYPRSALTVLFKPAVQIGEAIHTFIESLPDIDRAQVVFERRVNRHLVVGKPDIVTEGAVYNLKFRERLYRRPLEHDVLRAGIYAWLARKPYGHIIYVNPREFREFVVEPVTTETVLYLIEHPKSPRWRWECRLCPFKNMCPLRVIRRSSSSPEYEVEYEWHSSPQKFDQYRLEKEARMFDQYRLEKEGRREVTGGGSFSKISSESPEVIRIPELEKPENAKWLALLTDTEGNSLGWTRHVLRRDRVDERYRYKYTYKIPYIKVSMDEIESKHTIDEGARLVGIPARTRIKRGVQIRELRVRRGRAISVMQYIKPHLVKFRRLANLCPILFKYHTYIPEEKFNKIIENLFGTYVTSKSANRILLRMTETEFNALIENAEKLTDRYLK